MVKNKSIPIANYKTKVKCFNSGDFDIVFITILSLSKYTLKLYLPVTKEKYKILCSVNFLKKVQIHSCKLFISNKFKEH